MRLNLHWNLRTERRGTLHFDSKRVTLWRHTAKIKPAIKGRHDLSFVPSRHAPRWTYEDIELFNPAGKGQRTSVLGHLLRIGAT